MMSEVNLSDRFKQERQRLKLSLARVGEICGVSKNTAVSWEHGAKIPAEALALFAQFGADVQFIVTGVASANPPIPYDPAAYRALIDRVIALMAEWSLEPEDLAAEINESPRQIREALIGRELLPEGVLQKIVAHFQLSADWLFRGAGRMYYDPRPGVPLSARESMLVDGYRVAPEEVQAAVENILAACAPQQPKPKKKSKSAAKNNNDQ